MKYLFSRLLVWLFALVGLFGSFPAFSMVELEDEQLSRVTGQALLQMGKEQENGFTFYKAGLDAELELNMNIEKLQLGCGGVNGAGCDIDIDNLSLSGADDCAGGRPNCSGTLTRPFFEFAIKNDGSKTLREVVGIRLSAEQTEATLTFGTENSNTPNGINTISGYMKVQSDDTGKIYGQAYTNETFFDAQTHQVTGRLQALGLGGAAEAEFITSGGGFYIPAMCDNTFSSNCGLTFEADGVLVNNSRVTGIGNQSVNPNNPAAVLASLYLPSIYLDDDAPANGTYDPNNNRIDTLGGRVEATVTDCSWFACLIAGTGSVFENVYMEGQITNARADVEFSQSLGFIHKLPVDSPFYLSMQSEAVKWPGSAAEDVAQQGWWMSFANPVNVGALNPADAVDITPLFPQIANQVSAYLANNPATTNDLGGLLGIGELTVQAGTINLGASPLNLPLSDLKLATQNFNSNCYGSASFC